MAPVSPTPGRFAAAGLVTGAALGAGTALSPVLLALTALAVAACGLCSVRNSAGRARRISLCIVVTACALACGALRGAAALPPPARLAQARFRGELTGTVDDAVRRVRDPSGRPRWLVPLVLRTGDRVRVHVDGDGSGAPSRLLPGDRVRAAGVISVPRSPGNPGAADAAEAQRRTGVTLYVRAPHPAALERLPTFADAPGAIGSVRRLGTRVRRVTVSRLRRATGHDPETGALLACLLVGDRDWLHPTTERVVRSAGAAHLLVVSGLHVVLLVGFVATVLRRLQDVLLPGRAGRLVVTLLTLALLVLYAAVCRFATPVVRASVFVAVAVIARAAGRRTGPGDHLAAAAAIVAGVDPTQVLSPGFHLSFAAVAGLAWLTPRFREALFAEWDLLARFPEALPAWRLRAHRAVAASISASLAATTATAPVAAWTFGELHPAAVLSNAVAVPIVGALLPTTALAALAGGSLEAVTGPLLSAGAWSLLAPLHIIAAIPLATIDASPAGWQVGAAIAMLVSAGLLTRWTRRHLALPALAWAVLIFGAPVPGATPPLPSLLALDVGHGLAVLVRGGEGGALLYDAGARRPGSAERRILPALRAAGVRRLTALAISHEDSDHCDAVVSLLDALPVGAVLVPAGFGGDRAGRAVLAECRRRAIPVTVLGRGDRWRCRDLDVRALLPRHGRPGPVQNDGSLVLHVVAGDARAPPSRRVTALLPGDLDGAGLDALAADPTVPAADVLLLPHHGRGGAAPQIALARRVGAHTWIASTPDGAPLHVRDAAITGRDGAILVTPRGRYFRASDADP